MKWSLKSMRRASSAHSKEGRKWMHPMRDWMTGLGIATLIFVGVAGVIAYDFRVQFVLPPELTATTTAEVKYSERDVELYAERFNEKDAHFNALRAQTQGSAPVVPLENVAADDSTSLAPGSTDGYTSPALSP